MARSRPRRPRVALFVESSLTYGRGVLRGIARYLKERGPWSIFLEQRELGAAPPAWFSGWKGEGIVARSADARLRRPGVPLVALDDARPPDERRPAILNDNREVGRLAVRHLLDRGYRSLAFYGPRSGWWVEERLAGAREAAAGRLAVRRASGRPWEAEQSALRQWLSVLPGPVGLVAANDLHGLRALDACRRAGLGVPEQVAVVGADDDVEVCELSDPPLSSVAFNPERAGYEAADLLDRLMRGERPPRAPQLIAPLGVTARQSSDALAIADAHVARALHFIRRHACEGINVRSLLREVPLSRRSFEHRFRKAVGRTPKAEIRRLQIERAKELLSGSDLKLAAVADRAGFHQPAYLVSVFRRAVGLTPAAYRRRVLPK